MMVRRVTRVPMGVTTRDLNRRTGNVSRPTESTRRFLVTRLTLRVMSKRSSTSTRYSRGINDRR